jgi:DNA-binding response OmpR family regulator
MARVLLVEDEPNIGSIIAFKLGREGHEVRWEREAGPAVDAAARFGPALALVDTGLEGDALALLERLAPRCPVIVLTESRDVATPARALRAGAAATVSKPFKPTVLARTVRRLIDRRTLAPMHSNERDLGVEQEERLEEEGPVEEPGLQDDGEDINDPELQEDLRRAQTNPPQTVRRAPDPYSDIDRGYLEDEDARDLTEGIEEPLELEPEDPFEADEEAQDRPGPRS